MSDEPSPLSLRLKPRATPPANTPPPAELVCPQQPANEPAPAEPARDDSANDPLKLRLKPKTPPLASTAPETPIPFSNPPMAAAPVPAAPVPLPVPVVPITPSVPPPTKPVPTFAAKPPLPVLPPSVPLSTPHGESQPPMPGSTPPPSFRADKWLTAIVVLVAVVVGGFYGAKYLFKAHPKPAAPTKSVAASSAENKAPMPAKSPATPHPVVVDNPQSTAGKAVARARDTIAAVEKRDQEEGVSSVLSNSTSEPAVPRTSAAPTPSQPGTITVSAPPQQPAEPANQPEPAIPPSEPFKAFVKNVRVNGVFQGENARAMLNGKMYHIGDVVDAKLSVTLFKVEAEAKQLIFRDDTGAIVKRRY